MSAPAPHKDRIIDGLRAGVGGDADAFLAVLSPDIVIHEPDYLPYAGEHRGREAVLGIMGEAAKLIDFSTLEFESVVAEGDRMVMLMSVVSVADGVRRHVIEHWQIGEDGLVREVRVFWDTAP